MSYNHSISEDNNHVSNSILNQPRNDAQSFTADPSFGAWFIICFFGILVSIIIYPWYRLWKEKKDEEDQDALGSYYEAATFRYTFALRRNALRNENKIQNEIVADI